jgi:polyisoprenoid-binding protein YceI
MIKKAMTLALFIGAIMTIPSMAADKYAFDVPHSSVGFSVKHLLISNVKGNFKDFSGTIMFDEADMSKSSVEVTIKAASIDTDNENRDNHLRSADFFHVEEFPEITFKSRVVNKTDDGFELVGMLTMHGVTKEVTIPFEFLGKVTGPMGKERLGFEGHTEIDRKDYGITWNKILDSGGLTVGNEVKIELNIEAVKM